MHKLHTQTYQKKLIQKPQKELITLPLTKFKQMLICQTDEYKVMLPVALDNGVSPVEAKEVLYQAVDYLGLGRVFPFFKATNDVLAARGVEMSLPGQATTTVDIIVLKKVKRLKSAYLDLK